MAINRKSCNFIKVEYFIVNKPLPESKYIELPRGVKKIIENCARCLTGFFSTPLNSLWSFEKGLKEGSDSIVKWYENWRLKDFYTLYSL